MAWKQFPHIRRLPLNSQRVVNQRVPALLAVIKLIWRPRTDEWDIHGDVRIDGGTAFFLHIHKSRSPVGCLLSQPHRENFLRPSPLPFNYVPPSPYSLPCKITVNKSHQFTYVSIPSPLLPLLLRLLALLCA